MNFAQAIGLALGGIAVTRPDMPNTRIVREPHGNLKLVRTDSRGVVTGRIDYQPVMREMLAEDWLRHEDMQIDPDAADVPAPLAAEAQA